MLKGTFTILAILLLSAAAAAAGWGTYKNARYGYSVEIPPGFSALAESDNGDGGVSSSADGTSELRVWGGYVLEGDFSDEISSRIAQDNEDGWDISYEKRQSAWAAWSGSRDGRIFYQRAVSLCDDAIGYFRLEYTGANTSTIDPLIARLGRSLKAVGC